MMRQDIVRHPYRTLGMIAPTSLLGRDNYSGSLAKEEEAIREICGPTRRKEQITQPPGQTRSESRIEGDKVEDWSAQHQVKQEIDVDRNIGL